MSIRGSVQIHVTETRWVYGIGYTVACRCGWRGPTLHTREDARAVGDEHLAVTNGVEP